MFLKLAQRYQAAGHYDEAFEYYDLTLGEEPQNISVLDKAVALAMQIKDYTKALNYCQRLVDLKPDSLTYLNNYAVVCIMKQKFKQAEHIYQRLLALAPQEQKYQNHLAYLYAQQKQQLQSQEALVNQLLAYRQRLLVKQTGLTQMGSLEYPKPGHPHHFWILPDQLREKVDANQRQAVVILSPMRSGSTLLKALLAMAEDVSHLPETRIKFYCNQEKRPEELFDLAPERILVLKHPASFVEVFDYPFMPDLPNVKYIVLVRDAYDVVQSCRRMFSSNEVISPVWKEAQLLEAYWATLYLKLLSEPRLLDAKKTCFIRYEDLLMDPIACTQNLFRFIGSEKTEGTDHYSKPIHFEWQWGMDDGGDKIKSLQVDASSLTTEKSNMELLNLIAASETVQKLRKIFGYHPG